MLLKNYLKKMHRNTTTIHKPRRHHYEIIIPVAGIGRRMKSYGPKALIQINHPQNTIINLQLQTIEELFEDFSIILVCGFEAHKIMDYVSDDLVIVENERYETTNVVRSIGMGLRASTGNHVLIVYGDLVFNKAALNCDFEESCMLINNETMGKEEVGCIVNDDLVRNMSYDLEDKWGQIVYLTGKELELFKKVCWDQSNTNKFGFEALNLVINAGGKFKAVKPRNSKIIDVDKSSDILRAKDIV